MGRQVPAPAVDTRQRFVTPTGLAAELAARADSGRPIRIGLVGVGEMGTDIVTQVSLMKGLAVAVIAVRDPAKRHAEQAFRIAGLDPARVVHAETASAIARAVEAGNTAVTTDVAALIGSDHVDVVIDATGKPEMGAIIGLGAIEAGKHVVMMNVEADVTIGAYLQSRAREVGVVYTVGAGDEPSSTMELIEFVTALGYPVIAAGKGKNNPLDVTATPDRFEEEAIRRNMNPRMLVEFIDGSKTMVEMAAIANATGLVPDVAGMHGPEATLETLHHILCPEADGGILSRKGVVDYTIGRGVAPGVFVVAELSHPRLMERLGDLKLGAGPYYTFYRPYHLTSLEVPLSAARAVLHGTTDMRALARPSAEVCAVAKRDLAAGERLDAIGEYTYRAFTLEYDAARAAGCLPIGLIEGGVTLAPIKRGELLTVLNAAPPSGSKIVELRRRQDRMVHG
ncbi:homoserine dehydrogenase [Siculibacillus lacustris]|uniref:Homoserine dehydrogenase n=1 Tax=Siculibacillus lacustris TaxID=1549641 RepID=A0A4Q9VXX1_9HYPH|nr:homoserine dehydrogenase [Siculibacillus lacustris]TBW41230.1 homoserine dehydrogenase [Siculibacillus lacustris]